MSAGPESDDPLWPTVVSQAAHELRTSLSVAAGYLRMILKETAGPVTEQQRRFLLEMEKATTRLKVLMDDMSELARLDTDKPTFERKRIELAPLLDQALAALPPLVDGRQIGVELDDRAPGAALLGDARRLHSAFSNIFFAVRRELVLSPRMLVRLRRLMQDGRPFYSITIAAEKQIDTVDAFEVSELGRFNEKRGGCGLGPSLARKIITEHRGMILSPLEPPAKDVLVNAEQKAAAVVLLPES
jgi:signal transduction histidine kinase